jgi:ribosomal protein S20
LPSPEEQIQDIIEHVDELVDEGVLNKGQGNALQSKLENALRQLERGNQQAACNLLQAFINQVQSLVEEEILPLEQGQLLMDGANVIRNQICP